MNVLMLKPGMKTILKKLIQDEINLIETGQKIGTPGKLINLYELETIAKNAKVMPAKTKE